MQVQFQKQNTIAFGLKREDAKEWHQFSFATPAHWVFPYSEL